MTQLISRKGSQHIRFETWSQSTAYSSGDVVAYDNHLWKANGNIASGSTFTEGTTGATWTRIVTGMPAQPEIVLSSNGSVWCRVHAYGSEVYRSGSNYGNRVAGIGLDDGLNIGGSYILPFRDGGPAGWRKIQTSTCCFYGIGTDGALYVAGANGTGQLGLGATSSPTSTIIKNTRPEFSGPGIEVVDVWTTDDNFNPDSEACAALVCVLDNGTYKTYTFGDNSNGILGDGTTTDRSVPYLVPQLNGKRVTKCHLIPNLCMVVTNTGEVWGTGYNVHGTLGIGSVLSSTSTFTRARLNAALFVTDAVDARIAYHAGTGISSYILRSDGTVLSSGTGNNGRLGDNLTTVHQINYFAPVLAGPIPTILTNVKKIQAMYNTALMLTHTGEVYAVGTNHDGCWGNGVDAYTDAYAGLATLIQSRVEDFWIIGSSRGYLAGFFLKSETKKLYASGSNVDCQLGIPGAVVGINLTAAIVPFADGEWPTEIYHNGAVTAGGEWIGAICKTNKNRIWCWGNHHGLYPQNADYRTSIPVVIDDFYCPQS